LTPQAPLDPEQVEEKLAFALGDGRVGVLAVKGRKVPFPPLHTFVNGWMDDGRNAWMNRNTINALLNKYIDKWLIVWMAIGSEGQGCI